MPEWHESQESMQPPPTRAIAIVCLAFASLMGVAEVYMVRVESRFEVNALFLLPGAMLLGVIGLIDPRVTSSLQPGARGYPLHVRVIAHTCWVISAIVGALLYFTLVR